MRKFLSIVLVLLLFAPGAVCASMLCHHAGDAPCHAAHKRSHGPMLLQDCAKSDMQTVAAPSPEKPLIFSAPSFAAADLAAAGILVNERIPAVRGPPFSLPETRPSHLLLTLRFRP